MFVIFIRIQKSFYDLIFFLTAELTPKKYKSTITIKVCVFVNKIVNKRCVFLNYYFNNEMNKDYFLPTLKLILFLNKNREGVEHIF